MATPFIDVLTPEQQVLVARNSREGRGGRPTYFSAAVAQTQSGDNAGKVKISLDLEAVLITAPAEVKQGILDFLQTALDAASNLDANDFALFDEMLALRKGNYAQVNTDSGQKVAEYDAARSQLLNFIENRARQKMISNQEQGNSVASADATSVVIPDLAALFSTLSESYDSISRPDELAVHDRIADAGFVYAIQNVANDRARELSSWIGVIQTYMVT